MGEGGGGVGLLNTRIHDKRGRENPLMDGHSSIPGTVPPLGGHQTTDLRPKKKWGKSIAKYQLEKKTVYKKKEKKGGEGGGYGKSNCGKFVW